MLYTLQMKGKPKQTLFSLTEASEYMHLSPQEIRQIMHENDIGYIGRDKEGRRLLLKSDMEFMLEILAKKRSQAKPHTEDSDSPPEQNNHDTIEPERNTDEPGATATGTT